jgi:excinuclease ABC subunit C
MSTKTDNIPELPGVYRMLNTQGDVLYVGKAVNLKKRVQSYFNKQQHSPKTAALIKQIADISVTITTNEKEALLLESNLIKKLQPKYNVIMRDDKSYPYIYISPGIYPRLEVRRVKKKPQQGLWFGPYPSALAVQHTIKLLQKIFRFRTCNDNYFKHRSRPCLQYQINLCSAPCMEYIKAETYQDNINDIIALLQGKNSQILKKLQKDMTFCAKNLEFEKAVIIRNQIQALEEIQQKQSITQLRGDVDIVLQEIIEDFACIQKVSVRTGQVIATEIFFPKIPKQSLNIDNLWQESLLAFLSHHYLDLPNLIPKQIITNQDFEDRENFSGILSKAAGRQCSILTKVRGKNARWRELAQANLDMAVKTHLNTHVRSYAEHIRELLQAMQQIRAQPSRARKQAEQFDISEQLGQTDPLTSTEQIECFDISHTQGEHTIASCVTFNQYGPYKRGYRRFNISNIQPGDDCAALEQALTRRFTRLVIEKKSLPQILLIDGGNNQRNVACKVLDHLGVHNIIILSIVKGHARRAEFDRVLAADNIELDLKSHSKALHFLQYLRDEAHRFAITAHRKKRDRV